MFEFLPDSDVEIGSDTLNSSKSSMSSDSCSTYSRISFDALEIPPKTIQSPPPDSFRLSKPHRSSDSAWEAIRSTAFRRKEAGLSFRDFKLVRRIGSGDIGTVYLCSLNGSSEESCYYAMKVVDKEAIALKKKAQRAETEKRILRMLDHPFLPTLFAEFDASSFSCVVMEYCSGGDLHTLRHKLPGKRFSLTSARFYAAEVLVALEYLHMLGIIYRDLKPENVLVRSDGHIMLSDFDLSLTSDDSNPSIDDPSSPPEETPSSSDAHAPFCLPYRLFRSHRVRSNRQYFVAEPVNARSGSFVGTHEYVAPEVASGKSHGNAVDWWAFGIFLYELIYGRTPFAGNTNEATLRNIVRKPLEFPGGGGAAAPTSGSEAMARELMSGLLVKDPERRLGSKRGAAQVKTHPFFRGLNFALIRSFRPPEIPGLRRSRTCYDKKKPGPRFDYF